MDSLNTFICRQNITRYRAMLEKETDRGSRLRLARLVAEEEAKLAQLRQSDNQSKGLPSQH